MRYVTDDIDTLSRLFVFPDPESANEDGLVAVGGDLAAPRLLSAYRSGIFPWFIEHGTVFWFSPNPRTVLFPEHFKTSKSLRKSIEKQQFYITINTDFRGVMNECATSAHRKDESGTWISEQFIESYTKLHTYGYAMSVECNNDTDGLVGGLYGVKIGSVFFGESMFYKKTDASKAALRFVCEQAKMLDISLIDCQQSTPHLLSLGAQEIPRSEFMTLLDTLT